jgi:phosphatidylserine/phosphatidylglycerophosphate/cardiolipin synthase-like enzyme
MIIFAIVCIALAALIVAFLLGGKYGNGWLQAELAKERELTKLIVADRNKAQDLVAKAKAAAVQAGIDVKRVFPFLALLFAIGGFMASCDGGTLCHAQAVAALTPSGTSYSPETDLEKLDVQALSTAKATVDFAAFSLTDQAIADELKALAARQVTVRIYLDRGELQSECRADVTCARIPLKELIGFPGISIRVKYSKVLMHLKSYELDGLLLRDGSANFSIQGESRQDNSAVFTQDAAAVAGFERKFQAMWDRPDNLTVAQAVQSSPPVGK